MTSADDDVDRASEIEATVREAAYQSGAISFTVYPRPGKTMRRVVLREVIAEDGTQYEDATLEEDGTVRVTGRDEGPQVSRFWGEGVTAYDWVYVIAPARVEALVSALGGASGDDPLDLLARHYQEAGVRFSEVLEGPAVGAEFASWQSWE